MTRIGIVGASGMVGRAVAQHLRLAGMRGLRLGARRSEGLQREAREGEDIVAFALADSAQLQRFCEGCAIVVNAAGPSRQVLDRVARASLAAGAAYVGAAGAQPPPAPLPPPPSAPPPATTSTACATATAHRWPPGAAASRPARLRPGPMRTSSSFPAASRPC